MHNYHPGCNLRCSMHSKHDVNIGRQAGYLNLNWQSECAAGACRGVAGGPGVAFDILNVTLGLDLARQHNI